MFNETRSILEPAGAVAVAGAKAWILQQQQLQQQQGGSSSSSWGGAAGRPGQGPTVVAVTSGANINFDRLRLVAGGGGAWAGHGRGAGGVWAGWGGQARVFPLVEKPTSLMLLAAHAAHALQS